MPNIKKHAYGYKPDLPDFRDYKYQVKKPKLGVVDSDLRKTAQLLPVQDQGNLGSCTGHGVGEALAFDVLNKHVQKVDPTCIVPFSRLFIYYNGRLIEKSVSEDSGCEIRDVIKGVSKYGACLEKAWKYSDCPTKFKRKPSQKLYTQALKYEATIYERINNANEAEASDCLANGYPFVFGFTVYESFESDAAAKTGIIPMPKKSESVLGGHCTICIGLDTKRGLFICRNSWGESWGDKGDFYLPVEYMTNTDLTSDCWKIETVL